MGCSHSVSASRTQTMQPTSKATNPIPEKSGKSQNVMKICEPIITVSLNGIPIGGINWESRLRKELECVLCKDVPALFSLLMQTDCCAQLICLQCARRCLSCPTCRANLLTRPARLASRLVDLLPEECPHCKMHISRARLRIHLEQCPEKPTECDGPGCNWKGTLFSFVYHERDTHLELIRSNKPDYADQLAKLP